MVKSGSLGGKMISIHAPNPRDVGSISNQVVIFAIVISPWTLVPYPESFTGYMLHVC